MMFRKERKKKENVFFALNSHSVFVFSLFAEKLEIWVFFLCTYPHLFGKIKENVPVTIKTNFYQ